ncbi:MAG: YggS family pyridoxal phosphate-dependent enzyme [Patescibacteria group bacterium]|jgi:hypothetical protein
MSNIPQNLAAFKTELAAVCRDYGRNPAEISLVAITKNRSPAEINALLQSGVKIIGENRLQEFLAKKAEIAECEKHFVGRIQSNKAREIAREFDVIESVASVKVAKILDQSINPRFLNESVNPRVNSGVNSAIKKLPIFLQVNLARETQKDGFLEEDLEDAVKAIRELPNLKIVGLMTIGLAGDEIQTREIFEQGKALCDKFGLTQFSAGMSDDWQLAVAAGATNLRIGRRLFEN